LWSLFRAGLDVLDRDRTAPATTGDVLAHLVEAASRSSVGEPRTREHKGQRERVAFLANTSSRGDRKVPRFTEGRWADVSMTATFRLWPDCAYLFS
jgi:hypothetical protein